MKSRAAIAWAAGKPLVIEEVEVAAPKRRSPAENIGHRRLPHGCLYTLRQRSRRSVSGNYGT